MDLHQVVGDGSVEEVRKFLDSGADIDARNGRQQTPLHYAAMFGRKEVVALLLDHGATLETRNTEQRTPLHCAAIMGRVEVVALLLDRGASLEIYDANQRTPLHWAVLFGHVAVVALLLDRGTSVDVRDKWQLTPLHSAAHSGHGEVVALLLDRGASLTQAALDAEPTLLEPLVYRCRHSLEGLTSSDPKLRKTLEDYQRYRKFKNVDKHFQQIRRCDPKKATAIETMMMIYWSRTQATLQRLPYELLNMVFYRI